MTNNTRNPWIRITQSPLPEGSRWIDWIYGAWREAGSIAFWTIVTTAGILGTLVACVALGALARLMFELFLLGYNWLD